MKYALSFIVVFLVACGQTPTKTVSTDAAINNNSTAKADNSKVVDKDAASTDYIIQPGDILEISVWKEKDLQRDVVVRPDGGLTFPLIGEIHAAGKSIDEFQKIFTKQLSRYIPNPSVTVMSKQVLGNKIFVIGEVNKPGEYVVNRNIDVMQALSLAGGLSPYASERKIRILRRINGKQQSIKFQYNKVKKGKALNQNIVLQGGDIVVVP